MLRIEIKVVRCMVLKRPKKSTKIKRKVEICQDVNELDFIETLGLIPLWFRAGSKIY